MGTTMKGIYRGFKYTISQFFVVKQRELEIGHPTDVKHVAHIGWDGNSGNAPTWVRLFRDLDQINEFKTSPSHSGSALSTWSSHDFGESTSMRRQTGTEMFKDIPSSELHPIKKKPKGKKLKSTSTPKSNSESKKANYMQP